MFYSYNKNLLKEKNNSKILKTLKRILIFLSSIFLILLILNIVFDGLIFKILLEEFNINVKNNSLLLIILCGFVVGYILITFINRLVFKKYENTSTDLGAYVNQNNITLTGAITYTESRNNVETIVLTDNHFVIPFTSIESISIGTNTLVITYVTTNRISIDLAKYFNDSPSLTVDIIAHLKELNISVPIYNLNNKLKFDTITYNFNNF